MIVMEKGDRLALCLKGLMALGNRRDTWERQASANATMNEMFPSRSKTAENSTWRSASDSCKRAIGALFAVVVILCLKQSSDRLAYRYNNARSNVKLTLLMDLLMEIAL